ncbi:MAG: LPS assembly lipoprotein LptE [Desulfocapsaceae bacterium]
MKLFIRWIFLSMAVAIFLSGCGYRNPYVYSGPDKSIYVTTWKNRTSDLQLDAQIYQELLKWFQRSGSLKITKTKDGADFILAGEIISINIPSLAFDAGNTASDVRLTLKVRYIFKDLATDEVLIETPSEIWQQSYTITSDAAETRDNAKEAQETIIENMSQKIYQRTLLEISKL